MTRYGRNCATHEEENVQRVEGGGGGGGVRDGQGGRLVGPYTQSLPSCTTSLSH